MFLRRVPKTLANLIISNMNIDKYDNKGKKAGSVKVSEAVFADKVNEELLAQYIYVHNKRRALGTKKTKNRGEVAGGGKKPWRQKGTGRARHGSIRSPLWVGGGHAHAILPQMNRRIRLTKKMRDAALRSALSARASEGAIIAIESLGFDVPKTKSAVELLSSLGLQNNKVLFVAPEKDSVLEKSVSNLQRVNSTEARLLNPVDVLNYEKIVFIGEAIKQVEERVKNDK